jgi:mannose-6-phosphate isomerase-like protein (cupin superfamily)
MKHPIAVLALLVPCLTRSVWTGLAVAFGVGGLALPAMTSAQTPAAPLTSSVYNLDELKVEPTKVGSRRAVLDGPTTTLDKLHVHVTTLNPGEKSGEPRLHLQEEVIIVKEGTVEVFCDGKTSIARTGAVIFFAAHSTTYLHNTGSTPATYTVVYYYTPLTPKS